MARDVLKTLDQDTAQAMAAGASLLASNTQLAEDREALATLAKKVPALAKIQEQVNKALSAKGNESITELLNLSAAALQLRSAQAQTRAPSVEKKTEPRVAVTTDTPAPAAEKLHRALHGKGDTKTQTVNQAISSNGFRDLRFLAAAAELLEDAAHRDRAQKELLPSLGKAVVPFVRAAYRMVDNDANAARLGVLTVIEGDDALPLVREAWEKAEGSLKAQALRCLAQLRPDEAEPLAIALLENKKVKAGELRAAAASALGKSKDPRALDLLLAALSEKDAVSQAAEEALATLPNPKTTERLLALVPLKELNIPGWNYFKNKKKLRGKKRQEAEEAFRKEQEANQQKATFACKVLGLLGGRNEPAVEAHLLAVMKAKLHRTDINEYAGLGLARMKSAKAHEVVIGVLRTRSGFYQLRQIAHRLLFRDPKTSFETTAEYFDPKQFARKPAKGEMAPINIANELLSYWQNTVETDYDYYEDEDEYDEYLQAFKRSTPTPPSKEWFTDPRWIDRLLELAKLKNRPHPVLRILAAIKHEQAFDLLLEAIKKGETYWWNALAQQGPRAIPHVVEALDKARTVQWKHQQLLSAAEELSAAEFVAPLQKWFGRLKNKKHYVARRIKDLYEKLAQQHNIDLKQETKNAKAAAKKTAKKAVKKAVKKVAKKVVKKSAARRKSP